MQFFVDWFFLNFSAKIAAKLNIVLYGCPWTLTSFDLIRIDPLMAYVKQCFQPKIFFLKTEKLSHFLKFSHEVVLFPRGSFLLRNFINSVAWCIHFSQRKIVIETEQIRLIIDLYEDLFYTLLSVLAPKFLFF